MSNPPQSSLVPFSCFTCRSTYKRPFEKTIAYRKCPHCGARAMVMNAHFRPPKKSDDRQWKKVQYLAEHGFNFQKIYLKEGSVWQRQAYPKDLEEAKEFVLRFKDQAIDFKAIHSSIIP